MKKMIQLLASIGTVLVVVGCGSPDLKSSPRLNLTIVESGMSTPIAIHMFVLETDENFRRLDYFELMNQKRSKLGGDIVSQSKIILSPGSTIKKSIKLSPRMNYYAVVAGLKNVQSNDNWRYIKLLNVEQQNNLTLFLDNSGFHQSCQQPASCR